MSKDVQKHIPASRNLMIQVILWKMDECWNHKQLWLKDHNGMEGVTIIEKGLLERISRF